MSYELDGQLKEMMARHSPDTVDDEIRLAKSILELKVSLCKTDAEKAQMFATCVQAISQIEKMVHDAQKLKERTNEMISRPAMEQFARDVVEVISNHLKPLPDSDDLIAAIASDILRVLSNVQNPACE